MRVIYTNSISVDDEEGTEIARGGVIPVYVTNVRDISVWCADGSDFEVKGMQSDSQWVPTITGLFAVEDITGDGPYLSVRAISGTITLYLSVKGE